MTERTEIAVVGSGFAGSLIARVLATQGYDVVLLERGTHPRFAIGESSTPLANLSLERLATRYGLADLHNLAAHGRWLRHHPEIRRGLKNGFTFYRHHPDEALNARERLLVAASPDAQVADSHWLRADFDHHLVLQAIEAGVDYRDCTELTGAQLDDVGGTLTGRRNGSGFQLAANFVIDASGPNGFLARQLRIPSGLERTHTRSGLVFGHFTDVCFMQDVGPVMTQGPYVDDWAAVHHIVDEGWMYSLRYDHGVVSAGFVLSPRGQASIQREGMGPAELWDAMLGRYPTIAAAFGDAQTMMPIGFHALIQHRLTHAAGDRWLLLPHAYAFVDPLFSTGIAWSLRAVERLGMMFEPAASGSRLPVRDEISRYAHLLGREADQIDFLVAGAYEAMAHFDLFAAHAMIYFATVSFAEVRQRLSADPSAAWSGFLGIGDAVCDPLPREAFGRLHEITGGVGSIGSAGDRAAYADWVRASIEPRNVGGLADPRRHNLYPVDLDVLIDSHGKLDLTRDQLVARLPALRGMSGNRFTA